MEHKEDCVLKDTGVTGGCTCFVNLPSTSCCDTARREVEEALKLWSKSIQVDIENIKKVNDKLDTVLRLLNEQRG